jgi:hypothetical protein
MNWRIKIAIAAWVIAALAGALEVRNLMLDDWKDLHSASSLLVPVVLLLCSGSYFLLREVRRHSK